MIIQSVQDLIYLFCVFQLIWVMFVHFNYSLFLFSCNNRIFWLINNTNSLFRFLFPLKFLNGMKTSKFFDFKSGKNHRIIFHLSPWLTAPSFCGTIQPTVVRQETGPSEARRRMTKTFFLPPAAAADWLRLVSAAASAQSRKPLCH